MDNKESVKKILFEKISKCNNFKYIIEIGNFEFVISTKKFYLSLVNNSQYFSGLIDSNCIFYLRDDKKFWLSYLNVWVEIEKKTKLQYYEIKSFINNNFPLTKIECCGYTYLNWFKYSIEYSLNGKIISSKSISLIDYLKFY